MDSPRIVLAREMSTPQLLDLLEVIEAGTPIPPEYPQTDKSVLRELAARGILSAMRGEA